MADENVSPQRRWATIAAVFAGGFGLLALASHLNRRRTGQHEYIPGGLAPHGDCPRDVLPSELAKGLKVEMEHTRSSKIAQEIACDHLWEDPRYYTKLDKAGL